MKKLIQNFLVFFVIFLIIASIFSAFSDGAKKIETVGLETLVNQINSEQVEEILISGDKLAVTLKDGTLQSVLKETNESLSTLLSNYQVEAEKILAIKISVKEES
jgi:hypothetical protein